MNTKHTSGPWGAVPLSNGLGWEVIKGEWYIAVCVGSPEDGTPEANARLFAASPDLLDVAIQLEESLTADGYNSALVGKLRVAILKATGEA